MKSATLMIAVAAFIVATPHADAASKVVSCFETATAADQFVSNIRAHELSYRDAKLKRRKMLGMAGQSFTALRYILGDAPNISEGALVSREATFPPSLSQWTYRKRLSPTDVEPNGKGEYCTEIWSEIHIYKDEWVIDTNNGNVLSAQFSTEISR
jgi:hypothetical protein